MKQIATLVALFVLFVCQAVAQRDYDISYTVAPDTANHYLNVELDYRPNGNDTASTVLSMPVWAPGYYVVVDFPKYLCDFRTSDAQGNSVAWEKIGKNTWKVRNHGAAFKATYRIFSRQTSVAECRVEHDRAFVAPNGVFMYVRDDVGHPVSVTYTVPQDWKISTGLKPVEGQRGTYLAPNFDVLFDSPTLLGKHYSYKFTLEGHDYEYAIELPQNKSLADFSAFPNSLLANDFKKMIATATGMMRHVPYDNYCIIHLDGGQGGLEHANSQACYVGRCYQTHDFNDRISYLEDLFFFTHEFFHLYNVKHIRPIELGPFDYDRENFTSLLWVAEGFTVYYEALLLARAGLISDKWVRAKLSEEINTVESREGHRHMSLRQSSYDIWLNFFNQAENGKDVRISYYNKGPIIALLMDITIRDLTDNNRSVDDLMRLLYNRYDQQLHRGFTEEEFWLSAQEIAGQPLTELRRYVDTTDEIDYDTILARAGLRLQREDRQLMPLDKPTKKARRIGRAMNIIP